MSQPQEPLSFSIVVPAHNEEHYIEKTLRSLAESNYPRERFEVIVVENGSSDATAQVASACAEFLPALQVISTPEAGVSPARNRGIEVMNASTDWAIFLDADVTVESDFLQTLNEFLQEPKNAKKVIGTLTLSPDPQTLAMGFIFVCSNVLCLLFRSTYGGACFVRRDVLLHEKFRESMRVGEDSEFTNRVKKYGGYFFLMTDKVATSTRRYRNGGWKSIPLYLGTGLIGEFAPLAWKDKFSYKAVR